MENTAYIIVETNFRVSNGLHAKDCACTTSHMLQADTLPVLAHCCGHGGAVQRAAPVLLCHVVQQWHVLCSVRWLPSYCSCQPLNMRH